MKALLAQYTSYTLGLAKRIIPRKGHRMTAGVSFVLLFFLGTLATTQVVHGSEALLSGVGNAIIHGVTWITLQIATILIQLTVFLLRFFIVVAGYNNYIDAPVVKLGWNMVRDVANMFFVVILMVIAFATILGLEQYEWRKTLGKLLGAAVLVNFSNLILQLIIDVAQVFTMTFLNAIASAAGGNLIKMFNMDKIFKIASGNANAEGFSNLASGRIDIELFGAAMIAILFAGLAFFSIGAYVFILTARTVFLWVAIILSPLAFIFSVLPTTQSYSKEFWTQFINYVLAAPIMVFFLWLAFATFGGGDRPISQIEDGNPISEATSGLGSQEGASQISQAGISAAAAWDRMANFIVAMAFLWIGIERVQKLKVAGTGALSGASKFAKTALAVGTGYVAGRYLYDKAGGTKGIAAAGLEKVGIAHRYRLGKEKIKQAYYGDKLPLVGGGKKLRRAAELANMQKVTENVKGVQTATGDLNTRGSIAQRLAQSTIERENIEREAADDFARLQGDTRRADFEANKNEYNRLAQLTVAKEIAERSGAAGKTVQQEQARASSAIGQRKEYMDMLAEAQKKAIEANGGKELSDEKLAQVQLDVMNSMDKKGMSLPLLAFMEGQAGAKKSKAERELDIFSRRAKDADRMGEGKAAKYMRQYEDSEYQADMSDFAVMDLDTKKAEWERRARYIAQMNEKYGDDFKNLDGKELTDEQKKEMKIYKNTQNDMAKILASAHEQGDGNDIMEHVAKTLRQQSDSNPGGLGIISDDLASQWNTAEGKSKIIQAALTAVGGGVWDDDSAEGMAKRQEAEARLRSRLDDKAPATLRGLSRALNADAINNKQVESFNLMREGRDASGRAIVGFSDNMGAGVGKSATDKALVTGSKDTSGSESRRGKQEWLISTISRLSEIKDPRAIMKVDASGNAIGIKDEFKDLAASISQMSASEIRSLPKQMVNMITGGDYKASSYDNGMFGGRNAMSPEIGAQMKTLFSNMVARINEASTGSQTTYDRRIEEMQDFMFKLTGKRQSMDEIKNVKFKVEGIDPEDLQMFAGLIEEYKGAKKSST